MIRLVLVAAGLIVLGGYTYLVYRLSYTFGKKQSPLANSEKRQQLNLKAYQLINGLCIIDDINTDDVITDKTRRLCNDWLAEFQQVEKRY